VASPAVARIAVLQLITSTTPVHPSIHPIDSLSRLLQASGDLCLSLGTGTRPFHHYWAATTTTTSAMEMSTLGDLTTALTCDRNGLLNKNGDSFLDNALGGE